jgi:phosphatidate cytidylyltransferase
MAAVYRGGRARPRQLDLLFRLMSLLALRVRHARAGLIPRITARSSGASSHITPLQYFLIAQKWWPLRDHDPGVRLSLHRGVQRPLGGPSGSSADRGDQLRPLVCVYCVSYAPALLLLGSPAGKTNRLPIFLVLVVEISDVLQYVFGKLFGKRRIAPAVSPNKTWEDSPAKSSRRRRSGRALVGDAVLTRCRGGDV